MKKIDIRLKPHEKERLNKMVGRNLEYIIHEPLLYTPTVFNYIEIKAADSDPIYLRSSIEVLDWYGSLEDVAVWSIINEPPVEYDPDKTIRVPINETIRSIDLIQENQQEFFGDEQEYDNFVTRGIIFNFDNSQLSIEKSIWFSESFIIERGTNLIDTYAPISEFEDEFEPDYSGKCIRTIETLF